MMERSSSSLPISPAVPPAKKVTLSAMFVVAALVMLGVAGAWTYLARQYLATAIGRDNETQLQHVYDTLGAMRLRTRDALRSQCRVLAEDPRLKATLATEGIDEATVADILDDLRHLQHNGFLMVVSPDGRVFAETGADELRGLDISGSSVIQHAKNASDAVVGSWVIARQIVDLAAMPIRSDNIVIAYLVAGQAVDRELVGSLASSTGIATAIGLGNEIVLASTEDPRMRALFTAIANDPKRTRAQIVDADGGTYVTAFMELDETQTRPYLVLARNLNSSFETFALVEWLLFVPPGLVLFALLIARVRSKQMPRTSRTGGI